LRKAATRRLAENEATVPQMKSWTGHKSDREHAKYIAKANQARMNRQSAHLMANLDEKLAKIASEPQKRGQ